MYSDRRLTWQPAEGGQAVSVTVPDDSSVQFRVLSSGINTDGDDDGDDDVDDVGGRYSSVAELAAAFPTCTVRVQSVRLTARF